MGLVASIPAGLWELVDDEGVGTLSGLYGIMGLLIGAAQWLILRRRLTEAWIWVAANAAGLGLGSGLVLSTGLIDVSEPAAYVLVFAIYAALSAGALGWMLSRAPISVGSAA